MRDVPEELAARLENGAATLAHAWIVRRNDAVRLGFTDHDRDLIVEGVTCLAGSGWTGGALDAALGAPGTASVSGGLDDDAITEADIDEGLYDAAGVELWKVDWARPDLRVRLWSGRLSRIRREGAGFTADLEGPAAALDRVVGRTLGRDCDAELGDGRCGVDLSAFPGLKCNRRWETCQRVFQNTRNFRGYPDMPGDDFLTILPVEGGRNDGGSRR